MSTLLIDRIRDLVNEGTISRSGLARAAGLHANSLRSLDDAQWNPTADTLRKLESYLVRREAAPEPRPHLKLTAPSGEVWLYNDPSGSEVIEGLAEEFCQVVTQVRNIADTGLKVTGANAANWMSKAQCFAGDAEPPPAKGARKTAVRV